MKLNTKTYIGVRRKENQDNYWSALLSVNGKEAGVVCLCDGMGGLNNGGLASRIIVEAVREYFKENITFEGLQDVIMKANEEVYNIGTGKGQIMGTTCTVILCYEGSYQIYHVGDSRCYILNKDGSKNLLTSDHSALKKYGITKEKDPKLYAKYKNSLTRCIGVKQKVALDYYEGTYGEGDIFFLCSDGMWHSIEKNASLENSAMLNIQNMIDMCVVNGETDNITACILQV